MRRYIFSKLIKLCRDPAYRFEKSVGFGWYDRLSDKAFLEKAFRAYLGRPINWDKPVTFNEKLQWLKLYDRREIYPTMVDKSTAKGYFSSVLGTDEYCVPTLGVWDSFEEIRFDDLPEQFVLKCTHDSGGLYICKDKSQMDLREAEQKMKRGLKSSFFLKTREWQYSQVKPRIIAEPYLEDEVTKELRDYKFFAFDGEVKCLFVATDRQKPNEPTKFDFFDREYRHLDIVNGHPNAAVPPEKPAHFDLMLQLASTLSRGFPFLRVDLYEVNGRVYVGELTLHHYSGFVPFVPEKWDGIFGEWLTLPDRTTENGS